MKKRGDKKGVTMSESEKGKLVGEITHYFPHVSAAVVKLSSPLKVGDRVRIVGGGNEFEQEVASMQIDHEPIEEAKSGDEVGLGVSDKVREGYEVFVV